MGAVVYAMPPGGVEALFFYILARLVVSPEPLVVQDQTLYELEANKGDLQVWAGDPLKSVAIIDSPPKDC